MSCIYTGARVYFTNYGMMAPADLYRCRGAIIIRWNKVGVEYGQLTDQATHVLEYYAGEDSVWHREDLGVTVCDGSMIHELGLEVPDVPDQSVRDSLPGEGNALD